MTCKDCYHYENCHLRIALNMDYDETKNKPITEMEKRCEYFKDKSLIVELPCKVGDKVYYLSIKRAVPLMHKIAEAEVLDYNIDRYGIFDVKIRQLNSNYVFRTSIDKIYFTKSEAEAKLKELNNGTT